VLLRRPSRDPEPLRELEDGRAPEHRAVLQQRDRQLTGGYAGDRQQLARLAVALDVQPAGGNAVAREEVAQVMGVLGEAMPDDPHAAGLECRPRLPRRQQVLDDGKELLLGRVPGLEQVVVERHVVDGRDRGLGIGVGRQQHPLGVGHDLARLDEVVRARHAGHALVGDQQGDVVAARAQLAQEVQRLGARRRAQHAVALAKAAPQVARDRRQHRRLVVDGEDRRRSALGRLGLRGCF
jgi:hypothetical protein